VLDGADDPPQAAPLLLTIGGRLVSVADSGGGLASARFVSALIDAGAVPVDSPGVARPDLRIVVRGTPHSREARLRAQALEEEADVILGSVRPVFARYLCRLAPVG